MQGSSQITQIPELGPPLHRRILRNIKSVFLRFDPLYRLDLKLRFGTDFAALSSSVVSEGFPNRVLQSRDESRAAAESARRRRLPLHRAEEKNWDHIAAVHAIVGSTKKTARILDAGAELYSNVLPALFAYGYRNLYGMNLSFSDPSRRGPIRYLPGDITKTGFEDCFFDAVSCMSVIEHGVPIERYFQEMYRVLKPGGILITSTDYYSEPIDTTGKMAHGSPIKIFTKPEIEEMIKLACGCGFRQTEAFSLDCTARPVCWERYNLDYTFLIFTLIKP